MANVPAYCPTCGLIFPSPIAVTGGSTATFFECMVDCPNGHEARILDGTFYGTADALQILQAGSVSQTVLAKIEAIAKRVAVDEVSPENALNEVAELVPGELGAAIKQLGSNSAMAKFFMVLAALGLLATIAADLSATYRNIFKADPPPDITIHNNNTIINPAAPTGQRNQSVAKPLNRHERRRAEKLKRKNKKNRPDGKYR